MCPVSLVVTILALLQLIPRDNWSDPFGVWHLALFSVHSHAFVCLKVIFITNRSSIPAQPSPAQPSPPAVEYDLSVMGFGASLLGHHHPPQSCTSKSTNWQGCFCYQLTMHLGEGPLVIHKDQLYVLKPLHIVPLCAFGIND